MQLGRPDFETQLKHAGASYCYRALEHTLLVNQILLNGLYTCNTALCFCAGCRDHRGHGHAAAGPGTLTQAACCCGNTWPIGSAGAGRQLVRGRWDSHTDRQASLMKPALL